ncbi:aldose epimerase family protein [Tunturibacter empetritectus]|uniref:DUF4432 family protein n=1 Tax=Tunturiibacter empetritectus TaxID=3069691 RepID=A0A7W8IIT2_9BACT|nr:hypothetical protein [Edaphobacter lichenicola]MBB5316943.1 hypothetical protein [Edaphobacter lichenicola]
MNEHEPLSLQNELLRIEVLPSFGGKISSLASMRTGEEFLLPPLNGYHPASPNADFSQSDGGGFDECLPSVARSESIADEHPIPDHGDLWRQRWQVDSQNAAITLHVDAVSRPLRLTRKISLKGSSVILDYDLFNRSNSPTTWLWSAHPLLRVDAGDHIVLPNGINELSVEYSAGNLFRTDSSIAWPLAKSTSGAIVDLSEVADKDGVTAHKLFARIGNLGWGGLYRRRISQGLILRFDPSALPFIGIWICSGAWPENGAKKQYTVALEPTTSNKDSLASAVHHGTACHLDSQEHFRWRLELQLAGASSPISFEDFCTEAKS